MNRFRFYYEVAQEIFFEEETPAAEPPPGPDPESADDPNAEMPTADAAGTEDATAETPPVDETGATGETGADGEKKEIKDVKDAVDETLLIKEVDDKALITLQEQIDNLSIKLIEKKEKIQTVIDSISFLNKIDDTKPNKYGKEEKYKQLNGFLTSKEYDNLSPSNLYGMHNALKENFKIIQKDFKNKKDSKNMDELSVIAKKAKRARFSKNINVLNTKIEQIKNNLANLNQIFDLKDFPKMPVTVQKEIKLAQKNSSELIKKLS